MFGFGFGSARQKSVIFQHLEKPNLVSFMPRIDISSLKLKCEGGGGGGNVVEGKEKEEAEDLKVLYSNDEELFDLVINGVKEKIYMNSPEDRKLNRTWWVDLLRESLIVDIYRWEYEETNMGSFIFKNVTQDTDVQATIFVEQKGYTYLVGGEVLKHVGFYHIMEERANDLKKKMKEEKKEKEEKKKMK